VSPNLRTRRTRKLLEWDRHVSNTVAEFGEFWVAGELLKFATRILEQGELIERLQDGKPAQKGEEDMSKRENIRGYTSRRQGFLLAMLVVESLAVIGLLAFIASQI